MQALSNTYRQFLFPRELVTEHYLPTMPVGFSSDLHRYGEGASEAGEKPSLFTANLKEILDWLHGSDNPCILEEKPCLTPLLLYDENLSFEKLLFHYDGNPESARLIKRFLIMFQLNIKESKATIISPSFIPKAKMKEEEELIQLITKSTAESSFIKFNFNRIGDFWSYAVKQECTILITTKNHQADLAKVLFHFYKGGMWYDRLSFYLDV